jgi:hypothetical protein
LYCLISVEMFNFLVNGINMLCCNIRHQLCSDMASHPRRMETSSVF